MATLITYFTTQAQTNNPSSRAGWDWSLTGNTAALDGSVVFQAYPVENLIPSSQTDFLDLTDIATKLPDGAQIQGVSVRIFKSSGSDFPDFLLTTDLKVQFIYNGALRGQDKADTSTFWTDPGSYSTYGGSTDLWNYEFSTGGDSLTSSYYVNQPFFGLRIAATFAGANTQKNQLTLSIDHVEITFYYTEAPIEPPGVESGQIQSNVNRLAPGEVRVLPAGKNDSNPLSNINRLFAQYRLGGNVSNISPSNLPIAHRLSPLARIFPQSISSQTIGNHRLFAQAYIYPLGISSDQRIPTTSRLFSQAYIYPSGINSEETVTSLNTLTTRAFIPTSGTVSEENIGNHRLFPQANIFHQTIGSEENTSNNHSLYSQAFIRPNGIISREQFGVNSFFTRAFIYHQAPFDVFQIGWESEAHGVYLDPLAYIYVNNHAPGQPGYSPFDAPRFTSVHNVSFKLDIRPSGQVTGENDGSHRLTNNIINIIPPGTDDQEIVPPPTFVKDKSIYPPSIQDNNQNDGLGLHELYWKRRTINFLNSIYSPAYEVGYFDIMSLSRDLNMDPKYDVAYNSINTNYLFSVDNIKMNFGQNASVDQRLAGEGANPSTFKVNKKELSLSFTMPIKVESWGYVDNTFAALYDFCIQGFKGSPTYYVGRLTSNTPSVAIGATNNFVIDNVSDFLTLESGSTIFIRTDENTETVEEMTLDYVDKATKKVYFTSSTAYDHTPSISYLWAKPSDSTDREPSFTLFSLREGLISGCMVDKISFTIQPSNTITATIDLKFTQMDREYQKNILANFNTLVANVNKRKPNYLLSGAQFRLYNTTSDAGYFNLGTPIDRKYFHGFQETDIRNFEINEITIEISNNLQPVYSLNAKSSIDKSNIEKNLLPYAYFSNGRSINGSITYSSPIKPWLFAEKLSGPSSINNGGIIFDFGPFKLELPEIIWSTQSSESAMEQVHQKKVNWTVVSKNFDFDPYLKPTGLY